VELKNVRATTGKTSAADERKISHEKL